MANPMWVAGGKSANPEGRPKHSVRSPKGLIERFIKRVITPNRLRRIFDELSAKDQFDVIIHLMPYVEAKKSAEGMTQDEVDKLYAMVEKALNVPGQHGNTGS